ADGIVNGRIVDPSGLSADSSTGGGGTGGGGGGSGGGPGDGSAQGGGGGAFHVLWLVFLIRFFRFLQLLPRKPHS
ncbi:MAG: hypothetical protein AAF438_14225, partial [Pseudomonadota bacterium]